MRYKKNDCKYSINEAVDSVSSVREPREFLLEKNTSSKESSQIVALQSTPCSARASFPITTCRTKQIALHTHRPIKNACVSQATRIINWVSPGVQLARGKAKAPSLERQRVMAHIETLSDP